MKDEAQVVLQEELLEIMPEFNEERFKGMSLQPKELLFCYHVLLNDGDIAVAYKEVFGEQSPVIAKSKGNKIARKAEFKKATDIFIDEIWKQSVKILPLKMMKDLEATREMVISDFYNDDMTPKPLSQIPLEKQKLINNVVLQLDKQGIPHYMYDLASRGRGANTMLELLKAKGLSSVDDTKSSSDSAKEAAEMRNKIFLGVTSGNS